MTFFQQVADTPPVDTTHCDDPIMGDDASASPTAGFASRNVAECDLLEQRLCSTAFGGMKFRCIKVSKPDFDPGLRVR
jgi:hypothetical protein